MINVHLNSHSLPPTCFKYLTMGNDPVFFPSVDYFRLNSLAANNNRSHTNRCFILHFYFMSLFYPLHLVDLESLQRWHLLPLSPLKSRPTVVDLQMWKKIQTLLISVVSQLSCHMPNQITLHHWQLKEMREESVQRYLLWQCWGS